MKKRMVVTILFFAAVVWMNAQPKMTYTTVVIDYVGKTDRPVFPIIISNSADEADWYRRKLFGDSLSAFVHEYILRESIWKEIANSRLLNSAGQHRKFENATRISPALRLIIAKNHHSQVVTLEVEESVSFLDEVKKQVSEYPQLVEQLSEIEEHINRNLTKSH